MKTIQFFSAACLSAALCMYSCKGPQGDIGPAGIQGQVGKDGVIGVAGPVGPNGTVGPQGTTGATGAAGETGPAGQTGATGTANVIYSTWIARPYPGNGAGERPWNTQSFPSATTPAFPSWLLSNPEPKVTKDIVDKGMVMVYYRVNPTSNNAEALPYSTQGVAGNGVPITMTYSFSVSEGAIFIRVANTQLVAAGGTFGTPGNGLYRYVIVPGGIANGRMAAIDWKNYAKVKAALNLKD